ncbi:MAG: hypothetical protein SGI73_11455 [Chloroflexota bacterium]|nr:hypothetical protein [Chloroflexota bacterium]
MRKLALSLALAFVGVAFLSLIAVAPMAPTFAQVRQTATPLPSGSNTTTTGTLTPSSSVDSFFVACSDAAIVNLSGSLLTNFSVYFQIFASDGSAITSLRRIEATGDFTFSQRVVYPAGTALGGGAALTMQVKVARTSNSDTVDFDFVVSDVQDGCQTPRFTTTASVDTGIGATTTDTTTNDGITGVGFTTSLLAPNGVLNPNLQPEAEVVVGVRPSERYRSETPGVIFAECNDFPLANPGVVYDSDRITVYWSWFTKTQEQMQQHLANAQYSVRLNRATFPRVQVSEPTVRGNNVWVFYSADAGNLRPGHYEVEYRLTWATVVNDGYADFGPGTSNVQEAGNCNYNVLQNPNGTSVFYNDEFFPTTFPTHNLFPDT